jgi:hypothetical protein
MLSSAIKELEKKLLTLDDISYDSIDKLMRSIMKKNNVTAKELHHGFVDKHQSTPDDWIHRKMKKKQIKENNSQDEVLTVGELLKREKEKKQTKGPQLPPFLNKKKLPQSESISLVNKILSEIEEECNNSGKGEFCSCHGVAACPIKKIKSIEKIAKKHKVSEKEIHNQLKTGIDVEHEHTNNKKLAREIALKHLEERPDYYIKLKKVEGVSESTKSGDESLHDWFTKSKSSDKTPGWVQIGGPFAGAPCARQPGQKSTPKCGSSKMAADLTDKEEERAFRRKNKKDPNQPEKSNGANPTYVRTEEVNLEEEKDACYHKVKSRYKVWPSAYASGALVRCRKVGADNWGEKKNEQVNEATKLPSEYGNVLSVILTWRGRSIISQIFFPQIKVPSKKQVEFEVSKIYPDARVISYKISQYDASQPIVQVSNTRSRNYLLNNKTIGEEASLGKPYRTPGESKKFAVNVKNEKGNEITVRFGDPNMEIKRDDPDRLKAFRARHNCDDPGPRTKAKYWSCRQWRKGHKVED